MRPTTIIDGQREYRVYVRDTSVTTEDSEPRQTIRGWLGDFRRQAERLHAVCPEFTSEDYGIAKRLLRKYPWERLEKLAEIFWLQYSDPLDEGYSHPLKLFASAIPDIERRMG